MSLVLGLRHVLRSLVRRAAVDAETREELAFHLERQTAKHVAAGMTPADAARLARLELGGAERWREATADARRGRLLHDGLADARYALRGFAARPGFALAAIATVAIGVAAGTALFAVVDGALLRPLPFRDPGRIMSLALRMPVRPAGDAGAAARGPGAVDMVWSYPKYELLRERQTTFALLALHSPETIVVSSPDGAERVPAETAGADYFALLGVRPALGRVYTADEDRPGGAGAVVVLSDGWWRTRLGARADVLGTTLVIGGAPHVVIGVLPPGFGGLSGDATMWIPVAAARSPAALAAADAHHLQLVARLRDGVAPDAARAEVERLGRRIDETYPEDAGRWGATAYRLADLRVNASVRRSLALLGVAVALLLAIVVVNLSTLLLTRGAARRQELALRLALGGGRGRLVRQLATEAVLLAGLGGVAGLALAAVAARVLASRLPAAMPTSGDGVDLTRLAFDGVATGGRALLFALALALLVGAGVGAASAWRVVRGGLAAALRQGADSGGAPSRLGRSLASSGLVVAQVALAVVFLVVSGMTIQSLRRALAIPLGYEPAGLLVTRVTLDPVRAPGDSTGALWAAIVAGVRRLPGVRAVGLGSCAPIGMHCEGSTVRPQGRTNGATVTFLRASPEWFAALGTPLVRGRAFDDADARERRPVMIVNRAAARAIWGADDPLATPVEGDDGRVDVVGVADDARYEEIERPAQPTVFVPFRGTRGVLLVRADGDVAALAPAVRRAVRDAGAGHAMGEVRPMTDRLRDATTRNRLGAQVFTAFAASALLLAAIGVYGTLALRVAQRTRELAIRRALGADGGAVARLVGAQAAAIALAGGLAGAVAAVAVGRAVAGLLYDVRPLEPPVLAASGALLLLAVLLAAALPTARSLRVDPREAMRAE